MFLASKDTCMNVTCTHTHIIRNIFKRERTVKIVGAWMHL